VIGSNNDGRILACSQHILTGRGGHIQQATRPFIPTKGYLSRYNKLYNIDTWSAYLTPGNLRINLVSASGKQPDAGEINVVVRNY
jgi:hypothetical protein